MECFIETAKIAMKGRQKKFQYILTTGANSIVDIDGDEFSENDYGIVLDNSVESNQLKENLNQLAHAALQNQTLSFSSIMKIYTSPSLSEIQRIIEKDEKDIQERQAKAQQDNLKIQQQQLEYNRQMEQQRLEMENEFNARDNETKILVAEINAKNTDQESTKEELYEKIRQFDEKMKLEREKLSTQKDHNSDVNRIKERQLNMKQSKTK